MIRHKLLCSLLFTGISLSAVAQKEDNLIKKVIKKVFSSTNDSTRGPSFMVLPAVAYAQETGLEIGIASTYNFYMDRTDLQSKTSNVMLIATVTTEKQKKVNLTSDLWTKGNKYHILTDIRLRDWPFNFYGIGNDTWEVDEDYLEQTLYRFKVDVEKRLAPKFYLGVNANYDYFKFSDIEAGGIFESPEIYGKSGGQFLALGVSALYDTRDVTTFTTKGFYGRVKYAYAPDFFGKENYQGNMIEVDMRGYYPFSTKVSLATQGIYRGTYGNNIPFYAMRDLGGDMSMRGYYLGRYKDNNYATAQAELRYRFMPRFAATGFVGTGSTFSKSNNLRLVPSYGGGIRYFFSIEHSSSIRLDYAFGEKRAGEKRQSGFYLSVSEAF
ncbi:MULTISPECIES: BamA/TamA family outer membrane protein [Sphingobacterium]|uniref:BamA/TamA family outer membrane protein n=1 Tax=Sphingobacterium TaxID=28453 RepID=UPI0013DB4B90|nr:MULTISPECIES: BamA/TamA family outer membrane protein [unclassified Sphingobacterium]